MLCTYTLEQINEKENVAKSYEHTCNSPWIYIIAYAVKFVANTVYFRNSNAATYYGDCGVY